MRPMALLGMELKSTGAVPRPVFASVVVTDVVCRRLPLISTSVWSGLMPRSCAGRTRSAVPELDWRWKLNDGTSACSATPNSPPSAPALCTWSALITSTGTGVLVVERSRPRVPVTSMVSMGAGVADASACASLADSVPVLAMPARAMAMASGRNCVCCGGVRGRVEDSTVIDGTLCVSICVSGRLAGKRGHGMRDRSQSQDCEGRCAVCWARSFADAGPCASRMENGGASGRSQTGRSA